MKKVYKWSSMQSIAIFALVVAIVLMGCGGSPKPVASSSVAGNSAASSGDELDAAIREASDYLNGRIPKGNKVAFINISGGYPDLATYILDDLSKHGVNDGIFSVVDRAQLDAVRAELNFNMSGEVSDQSAQEIGKMLGAQTIVSGSVQQVGTLYRLTVKAIEVQTAGVQGQWNKNIPNSTTIAALTKTSGGSATASTSGQAAAAPTTPAVTYKIGDTGPAGGLIFYDKGNSMGGWRYMEAAPADLGPAVAGSENFAEEATYHSSPIREPFYKTYHDRGGREVGKGKYNTEYLMEIAQMRGGGFGWAVQLCDTYELNGFNDWFLPSLDELNYMYGNLHMRGLGNFRPEQYRSSSGSSYGSMNIDFSNGKHENGWWNQRHRVRPIRQF